ncbi:hypothetical protein Rhopal_006346-T1 [Rhodotorula paludigena]|uniref:O-fucosyltransferase family protein n=1 Tax=Rhodotorula paludigena TaxID=86838 RepID=A0AAV5GTN0_9BASI|nr:hypothetical protein Rhopal_006346-T1 [Rhodotorula paludigena]
MPPVHGEGSTARLSDFFDVPKWIEATNVSIVEFSDAKSKTAALPEDISCWGPAWNRQPFLADYKTTMHSWPFPPNLADGRKTSFQAIEVLAASDHAAWLDSHAQAEYGGLETAPPRPEAQLLCFQNVYYVQELVFKAGRPLPPAYTIEELPPDRPLWSLIGRHLRFTRQVDYVVDDFLRTMYGGRIGKFIGVHVRQGDFIRGAKAVNGSQELVDVYAGGVREIQAALKARGVIWRDAPVVFATDSQDAQFLKLLAKMGWIYLDHGKFSTLEKYGGWYPGLLDSAVLSRGIGFVGTHKSTFSYMAQRRVETWNNGIGMVVDAKPQV